VQRVPLTLEVLMVVVLGVSGALRARRLRRAQPPVDLDTALKRVPALYLIAIAGTVPAGVRLAVYLEPKWARLLPLWMECSINALVWGGILAVFSFGFALTVALAFASAHPRRWSLAIVSVALLITVEAVQFQYARPIAPELRDIERDGVVLQSSAATCVSASAANLLRLYGVRRTEKQMAELFGASAAGATSAQLLYGLSAEGFVCEREFHVGGNIKAVTPPAIVFYGERYGVPHAVVLASRNGEQLTIVDPLGGKKTMSASEVSRFWDGEVVRCRPPAPTM